MITISRTKELYARRLRLRCRLVRPSFLEAKDGRPRELQSLPYTVRARRVRVADLTPFPIKSNRSPLNSRKAGASDSLVCAVIVLLSIHLVPRSMVAACCHGPLVPLLPPLARLCILRDDRAPRGETAATAKVASFLPQATDS